MLLLYRVFILPVIPYGAKTWSRTQQLARILDAFYQYCLHHILRISWRTRICNEEVRQRTGQPPLVHIICTTCLNFLATLLTQVLPWTTVELFGPVWSLCQGTGIADQADHATRGSIQFNQIWHHSTLVWQLPITECRIDKHEARLWERQHPLHDKPHND